MMKKLHCFDGLLVLSVFFLTSIVIVTLFSCSSVPDEESLPQWFLQGADSFYDDAVYIARQGYGDTEEAAKADAVSKLGLFLNAEIRTNLYSNTQINGGDFSETAARTVNIESDIRLFGTEFSEACFDTVTKQYTVVCFISRAKAYEQLKPELEEKSLTFLDFFDKASAEEKTNPMIAARLFGMADKAGDDFRKKAEYAALFDLNRLESDYGTILEKSALCKNLAVHCLGKSSVFIDIDADFNNSVKNAVSEVLSAAGMIVSKTETNSEYKAFVRIEPNMESSVQDAETTLYALYPSLELNIVSVKAEATVFSWSCSGGKSAAYSRSTAEKKAYNAMAETIRTGMLRELNNFFSLP